MTRLLADCARYCLRPARRRSSCNSNGGPIRARSPISFLIDFHLNFSGRRRGLLHRLWFVRHKLLLQTLIEGPEILLVGGFRLIRKFLYSEIDYLLEEARGKGLAARQEFADQ